MNSLENFHAMMDGGHPEWLPFYLPTTGPVERRIVERTGRPSSAAFDTDFRGMGASYRGDDPVAWRSALEKTGVVFPDNSVVGGFGMAFVRPPVETLGQACDRSGWRAHSYVLTCGSRGVS